MHQRYYRLAPLMVVLLIAVAVSMVTRGLLALRPDVVVSGGAADWLRIFSYGLLYDVIAAAYLAAPLVLWLAAVPHRLARSWPGRLVVVAAVFGAAYVCLLLGLSEWLFWDEYGSRFNFIAVDYLLYTHEVLGNIWESYPVGKLLLVLLLPAALVVYAFKRPLWNGAGAAMGGSARLALLGAYVVCVAVSLRYVDTDLRNFSREDAPNDLAANGLYEFFAANYRNELSYDQHYATIPIGEALMRVRAALGAGGDGLTTAAVGDHGTERHIAAPGAARRLNVVLVSIESLGSEFLGSSGNPKGLTPNLDRLAAESLSFSRVYATGNRTVRGMEALALSIPPTPGQSIVRRPRNEQLFSLGSVFDDLGYGTTFAYGGYGYFDNLVAFFGSNDYRAIDRRSIPSSSIEFENIWGVADEHLYAQVLDEIDRETKARPDQPVFVHVMTTSNHRPYTYPPNRIDIPSGTGRDGAVKYTDYAVGNFMEAARRKPWFDNTLFVITADHGANARGTMQIPIEKYRVPLFIYAPRHIEPRRVDRLMSQIDIAPTLLGLLGFSYYSKFFGRDILHSDPQGDRAFVANYQTLGYITGDQMVVLEPRRKVSMYKITPEGPVRRGTDMEQAREAIAFYQAASYVFRNGLYRDEEQKPPIERAGQAKPD